MNNLKQTHGKNGVPELKAVKNIPTLNPELAVFLKALGFTKDKNNHVKGPFTRPTAPAEPSVAYFNKVCYHPSHKPPSYIWCRQGDVHTHTCPGCGEVTYLTIVRYNHDPRKD